MKALRRLFGTLYTVWVGISFIVPMLLFFPLFMLYPLFGPRANLWLASASMIAWFRLFGWLTFIRFTVHDRHVARSVNGRPAWPCVYVGNHSSFLDIPAVKPALGFGFLPLGKREQVKTPVLGWIYRHNVILIDRADAGSRSASMLAMRSYLERGISVLVFAEGTMNRTDHLLKPFFDGAFRLAIEAQVPIVPFATIGARELMPRGTLQVLPGHVQNWFAAPVDTLGMTEADIPALRRQVFERIWNLMLEHGNDKLIGWHQRELPPLGWEAAKAKAAQPEA